jgi:hypothetical protein
MNKNLGIKKGFMKIFSCILLVLITPAALAAKFSANLEVGRVRVHESATYFKVTPQPIETCSSWGEYFKFDHRTETGKAFLGLLFTAKTAKAKI